MNDTSGNPTGTAGTSQNPVRAFLGSKGGVGTTCFTVAVASTAAHNRQPVTLVDLSGDLASVLNVDPDLPGIADWIEANELSLGASDSLTVAVSDTVELLPRGTSPLDVDRLPQLWALLTGKPRMIIIDAGRAPDGLPLVDSPHVVKVLVTAACYQSVIRTRALLDLCDELLVVTDCERALTRSDIELAVGRVATASVERGASLGRMADAGLLLDRGWRFVEGLPDTWTNVTHSGNR